MKPDEYRAMDATALAGLWRAGKIPAVDLLDCAIDRLEEANPSLNAVVYTAYEAARATAGELDQTRSRGRGRHSQLPAFGGVPFPVKDLGVEIAGMPLRSGCRGWSGYTSRIDSPFGRRLRELGFVIFGKTNTPEFGLYPVTESKAYGACRNPFNLKYSPGGASGGAAAAVASKMVPMAGASDGGGSIRTPAACCGLIGIKPSQGVVAAGDERWAGISSEGCVSRTVRDTAAFLDSLHSGRSEDTPGYVKSLGSRPHGLRVAFSADHPLGAITHEACRAAVIRATALLEPMSASVDEIAIPFPADLYARLFLPVVAAEVAADIAQLARYLGRRPGARDLEPDTRLLGEVGRRLSAMLYVEARRGWQRLAAEMAAFHDRYDILLTPVLATPPPRVGTLTTSFSDQMSIESLTRTPMGRSLARPGFIERLALRVFALMPFTPPANMTGQPAISLPIYRTSGGLPVGVQAMAARGRDRLLLQLAAALEADGAWTVGEPVV